MIKYALSEPLSNNWQIITTLIIFSIKAIKENIEL